MEQVHYLGTLFFAIAVAHSFFARSFLKLSHRYPKDSLPYAILHILGEVELVFILWAIPVFAFMSFDIGFDKAIKYQEALNLAEPLFVFAILVVSSTNLVISSAERILSVIGDSLSKLSRLSDTHADVFVALTIGPLAGSFITEPAAMTVTAFLLLRMLKNRKPDQSAEADKRSDLFLHALMAVLFVNVSIGGALTHFAAPPILMVARTWAWDTEFVFTHFGWKAMIAVFVNASLFVFTFRKQISSHMHSLSSTDKLSRVPPHWVLIQYLFLVAVVVCAHYPQTLALVFVTFLGFHSLTKRYQGELRFKESFLVTVFLAGIVFFGPMQAWWLTPILTSVTDYTLFLGATALTAVTDNAALTYLGAQVPDISDASKYFLVAGAVAGGGLTLIANAPNAAGFGVLQGRFQAGFKASHLLMFAIVPTLIAVACFGLL